MRTTCASSREAASSSEGSGPAATHLCRRAAQWLTDPGSSSQKSTLAAGTCPASRPHPPTPGHAHPPLATPTRSGLTHPTSGHTRLATPTQPLVTSTPPPVTSTPMGSAGPTGLGFRPAGSGELPSPEPGVSPYCFVSPVSHRFSFSRHLQWRLHLASVDSIPSSR